MLVAVLIARPGALDPALVGSLRDAFGGGALRWLSPGEAAEFDLPAAPGNFETVRADLQGLGVDLNLVPAENRRKKLLLADMDSTMIGQECIDELAELAGVGAHVKAVTARAMNGELDFEEALRERVALLKDQDEAIIARVLETRITPAAGGHELVATMRANGAYAALVSGGFTAFTAAVGGWFGFDENRANTLVAEAGKLTGTVTSPILGREAKVEALQQLAAKLPSGVADAVAVGDGANDLGMLGLAGFGVALHAKPSVAAQCDLRVNQGDLTALLFLQGYQRSEFVSA